MAIAFSVLSLKRNRSTSNNKESVSKLSKLKSGFSIFTKIGHVKSHHHDQTSDNSRRTSFIGLLQYFRSNEDHKGTYDSDSHYEYNRYHNIKKNQQQEMERNIHTLPINATPKLTSILIKRSGTTPSSLQHIHQQQPIINKRARSYSNATISNMTINSEDLTAKEFADIAGIRILPEEDQRKFSQEGCSEDLIMNTISSLSHYTTSSMFDQESQSIASYTSLQTNSNELKIWDNEFWFHPEVETSRSAMQLQAADLDRKLSISSTKLIEPPILHELRRMGTRNSEKDHCVIKKGRFEIQLGAAIDNIESIVDNNNNDSSTLSFSDPGVLEWKRKGKKPAAT